MADRPGAHLGASRFEEREGGLHIEALASTPVE
jgi:hypothetical protein